MRRHFYILPLVALAAAAAGADPDAREGASARVRSLCERLEVKLDSVSLAECLRADLVDSGASSIDKAALAYRDILPTGRTQARVLLIGGIHGDEFSSVSTVFKWLAMLERDPDPRFHWRIVPVSNPDGLLRPPTRSQRVNANGVDLNRNFPTDNWEVEAWDYWVNMTQRSERRYPGSAPLSEPESAWLAEQIDSFRPDAVISVHAPHGIVDCDGPNQPPENLGPLELQLLGTYPGSMGRYVGVNKGIPLLTIELESAEQMPSTNDITAIWRDTVSWLDAKVGSEDKLAVTSERPLALD